MVNKFSWCGRRRRRGRAGKNRKEALIFQEEKCINLNWTFSQKTTYVFVITRTSQQVTVSFANKMFELWVHFVNSVAFTSKFNLFNITYHLLMDDQYERVTIIISLFEIPHVMNFYRNCLNLYFIVPYINKFITVLAKSVMHHDVQIWF
jgi:hypothetical protein